MKTAYLATALLLLAFSRPAAHAAPGDLDPLNAFNLVGLFVYSSVGQPDGKTIIAGQFTTVKGVARNNIARLNADGTLDAGFDPNANNEVYSVAVQADGKILLGGHFTTLRPNGAATATARNYIARLNADGTLDTGFNPNPDWFVHCLAVQANGQILLGGWFGNVGIESRQGIARVNTDGTVDTGFDPDSGSSVYSVTEQADGRILLGGGFTTMGGITRNYIARVYADGTLDMGFDPNANSNVNSVVVQADGKILLGGYFTTLQPNWLGSATTRNRIARVNADGTLDPSFNPKASATVWSLAAQADGKILIGGEFNFLQPNGAATSTLRQKIARVNADGTLETGFDPFALGGLVSSVVVQADGRILLGGSFQDLQPNGATTSTGRQHFARLLNDPATQTLSAPNATQVTWTRGGSSPEVSTVTFEKSTDSGVTWTPLGIGIRIGTTPNWQLTGLSLPASFQLRARGRTTGGYGNGSSSIVETTASFPPLAPEIAVEQPAGITNILDGGTKGFGSVLAGSTADLSFTVKNTGTADLTLSGTPKVAVSGTDAALFTVTAQPTSPVAGPSGSTTFTVRFAPTSAGAKTAALSIPNNDGDENPFDIAITGDAQSTYIASVIVDDNFNRGNQVLSGTAPPISAISPIPAYGVQGGSGTFWQNVAISGNRVFLDTDVGLSVSISSTGSYTKPALLRLSASLNLGTLADSGDFLARGVCLGFYTAVTANPGAANVHAYDNGARGLALELSGKITLMQSGGADSGFSIPYSSALFGGAAFNPAASHTLSYQIDTTSGDVSAIRLDGVLIGDFATTVFTDANTPRAGFWVGSTTGSRSGYIDDFMVEAITPANLLPTVVTTAATSITTTDAVLNGTVNANGSSTDAFLDLIGESGGGGFTAYAATPATVTGNTNTSITKTLTGLTPGSTYSFRARGVSAETTVAGDVLVFTTLTTQQGWRQTYFGTSSNTGNAADNFDFDKDGLSNLLEWACNLNPTIAGTLPITVTRNGAAFEFIYTRSVSALNAGATFTVEWSDTLPGASWSIVGVTEQILFDHVTVQQVKATIPAGASGHRFVHLKVTGPP